MRIVIVHQHNFELAEAKGLASKSEHIFPYTDAMVSFSKRHVEALQVLWHRKCYKKVAEFNLAEQSASLNEILEFAWTFTQNLEGSWVKMAPPGVALVRDARSSMIGDIIEYVDESGVSRLFRVDSFGFRRFEEMSEEQIRKLETDAGLDGE